MLQDIVWGYVNDKDGKKLAEYYNTKQGYIVAFLTKDVERYETIINAVVKSIKGKEAEDVRNTN